MPTNTFTSKKWPGKLEAKIDLHDPDSGKYLGSSNAYTSVKNAEKGYEQSTGKKVKGYRNLAHKQEARGKG